MTTPETIAWANDIKRLAASLIDAQKQGDETRRHHLLSQLTTSNADLVMGLVLDDLIPFRIRGRMHD